LSLSNSINDLFAMGNLRRRAEGGDPSAIKLAAAAVSGSAPGSGDQESGTGAEANNLTSQQMPYASQFPAGPYGRAVEMPKGTAFTNINKPVSTPVPKTP
jgi:hypothetical protein